MRKLACSPDHRPGMAWTLRAPKVQRRSPKPPVAIHPLPRLAAGAPFDSSPDTPFFAFSSKRLSRPEGPCNGASKCESGLSFRR